MEVERVSWLELNPYHFNEQGVLRRPKCLIETFENIGQIFFGHARGFVNLHDLSQAFAEASNDVAALSKSAIVMLDSTRLMMSAFDSLILRSRSRF
ncbi:hypothetical protein OFY05_23480 (plasmid) [Pseudocitrobacter faecalis]|nr:hypothetical protein OFY05_23480 [Pseudocitrobacter faecalis]